MNVTSAEGCEPRPPGPRWEDSWALHKRQRNEPFDKAASVDLVQVKGGFWGGVCNSHDYSLFVVGNKLCYSGRFATTTARTSDSEREREGNLDPLNKVQFQEGRKME